ncbi:hypothetical protein SDC9_58256 [bioreactor metagenome]|uniref:Helix-turn-helix domain-containing protein n=1 Tax=bioreactor metagenome TaxID=1076179 RepID=A0A644X6X8_9ZZZZ
MSFAMIPDGVFLDESICAKEKLVLAVLYFHRNQRTGECFPSLSRISKCSGLSPKTVKRAISILEAGGRIERKKRFSPNGDPDSNSYFLTGWGQADPTRGQIDPTLGQADPTRGHPVPGVGSHRPGGWGQGDPLTYDLNKEEEQKNLPPQSPASELKPRRNVHGERIKAAFEEVWQLYPKKQGKRAAFEVFSGFFPAILGAERLNQRLQNIGGQATLYAKSVQGTEARYIKNPVNWLREIDPDEVAIIEEETWVRAEGDE